MKAMILAAGKGTRLRPLTEHTPKPLLLVGGKPLIIHHLTRLASAGFSEIVINVAYLGKQIIEALGDGSKWGVKLEYSQETEPLETAGAILYAQALLGDAPFLLINGDVWSDYPLDQLHYHHLDNDVLAHLILVDNPAHNAEGDFSISPKGLLTEKTSQSYTFSGMSIIHPNLITHYPQKRQVFPLGEVFNYGIEQRAITAEVYKGDWVDVGTIERLNALDNQLRVI